MRTSYRNLILHWHNESILREEFTEKYIQPIKNAYDSDIIDVTHITRLPTHVLLMKPQPVQLIIETSKEYRQVILDIIR